MAGVLPKPCLTGLGSVLLLPEPCLAGSGLCLNRAWRFAAPHSATEETFCFLVLAAPLEDPGLPQL